MPEILIVGAGPTGLVLALWLNRLGVPIRIVDKAPAPGTTSRALGVHARTLEFYRQLGLAEALVDNGLEFAAANLWVRGEKAARAAFGEMGKGLSPFPYILIYPQDEHERLLIGHLPNAASRSSGGRSSSTSRRRDDRRGRPPSAARRVGGGLRGRPTSPDATERIPPSARPSGSAFRAEPMRMSSMSPTSRRAARRSITSCTSRSTTPTSWRSFR